MAPKLYKGVLFHYSKNNYYTMAVPCPFCLDVELKDINNDVEKKKIVEYTRSQLRKYICSSKEHVLMPEDWSFNRFFQMRKRFTYRGWRYLVDYDTDILEAMTVIDKSILVIWEEIKKKSKEIKVEGEKECLVFGQNINYETDHFSRVLNVSINICLFWT